MPRAEMNASRWMMLATVVAALALSGSCSRKPAADLARARPVMNAFLKAELQHRGSNGNFWRDHQPKVDRNEAVKVLGVDIAEAPGFEFTIEPSESGYDSKLRIGARAKADPSVSITCVLDAAAPEPECKESQAAPS